MAKHTHDVSPFRQKIGLLVMCAMLFGLIQPQPSQALTLEEPLPSATHEARARALFKTIRCMVCDGQALSSSDAEHALDMRRFIRHMITDGKSDAEIYHYLTARYGEEALLIPPKASNTLILWLAPLLFFAIGTGCWLFAKNRASCKAKH